MPPHTCAHCNSSSTNLQMCSNCEVVHYCNKACQIADWENHEPECKATLQQGDLLWIGSLPSDPNQPREFPTWEQYTQECNDNGRLMVVPFDCCIQRRMSNGIIDTLVDEDLYQELQKQLAEQKAAEAAQAGGEDSTKPDEST
jgi:hypothetical protein